MVCCSDYFNLMIAHGFFFLVSCSNYFNLIIAHGLSSSGILLRLLQCNVCARVTFLWFIATVIPFGIFCLANTWFVLFLTVYTILYHLTP
jgi:hypothetical protein